MKIFRTLQKHNGIKAFTMTEVVIATLIFSLAIAGIFASIANLRQPAVESSQEVTAAFIGKRILDNLRAEVNAESWNDPTTGQLLAGNTYAIGPITVGNTTYSGTYDVIGDPDNTKARQVTLNITW